MVHIDRHLSEGEWIPWKSIRCDLPSVMVTSNDPPIVVRAHLHTYARTEADAKLAAAVAFYALMQRRGHEES